MKKPITPTLYVFSGLPAVGKSTLAKLLASSLQAQWLRIDSIEQTLKQQNIHDFYDAGYQIAFTVASDNLKAGLSVIADSCNTIEESRQAWREVAQKCECRCIEIEVICSAKDEHKYRVENRKVDVANLTLPSWQQVQEREYEPWLKQIIQIDTAGKTPEKSFQELLNKTT